MLSDLLEQFRDSENPELRLAYSNSLRRLLEMGEKLHDLQQDEEKRKMLAEDLQGFQKMINEYKMYPLIQEQKPKYQDTLSGNDKQNYNEMFEG